jgi:hypothetical protein
MPLIYVPAGARGLAWSVMVPEMNNVLDRLGVKSRTGHQPHGDLRIDCDLAKRNSPQPDDLEYGTFAFPEVGTKTL